MTKEQMIDKIYEVIADKTLSFGCLCIVDSMNPIKYRMCRWDERPKTEILKIIWHPVMIWDVLDWIESWKSNSLQEFISDNITWVIQLWKEKRKPIEEQELSCISYIYSLIS